MTAPTLSLHWHEVGHGISFSTPTRDGEKGLELRRHFIQSGFKRGGVGKRDRWTAQGEERAEDLFPWLLMKFDVENAGKPSDGTLEAHHKAAFAIERSRNPEGVTPAPEPEPAATFETGDLFKPS